MPDDFFEKLPKFGWKILGRLKYTVPLTLLEPSFQFVIQNVFKGRQNVQNEF